MKKLLPLAGIVIALTSAAAFAGGIENKDSKTYKVDIIDGASTTETTIDGNTTNSSVCSDCKVKIHGVGTFKLSGSQTIVIQDGKGTKS